MRKILNTLLIAACPFTFALAQTSQTVPGSGQNEKMVDHIIGVQLNGLINQVFNFSNTTQASSVNPYLFTYNVNSRKTGWGIRVGVGYNYNSSSTNDNINVVTTKLNDLHARLGIEKRFQLSGNWSAGVGLDFVYNANNDNTNAQTISSDTITTNTKTVYSNYGGGAMGWLRYNLTKNLVIGTETSFYYTTGYQKITYTFKESSNPNTTAPSVSDNKLSQGTMNMPIVFYLAVKF